MIYSVEGPFLEKTTTLVVVDCGGVGYEVHISLNTYADLNGIDKGRLYTYQHVREDALQLYGFSTLFEKKVFVHLISVSGVGANTARVILSSLRANDVQHAIIGEDVAALQSIKGIGAKTAQRIVLDLRDKMLKMDSSNPGAAPTAAQPSSDKNEAHAALTTLGITPKQADAVLSKLLKNNPAATTEELVRGALQLL